MIVVAIGLLVATSIQATTIEVTCKGLEGYHIYGERALYYENKGWTDSEVNYTKLIVREDEEGETEGDVLYDIEDPTTAKNQGADVEVYIVRDTIIVDILFQSTTLVWDTYTYHITEKELFYTSHRVDGLYAGVRAFRQKCSHIIY